MKNLFKVLLGFFVSIIYIPVSIGVSYTVISVLTNIFNKGYESGVLNILFFLVGLAVLLALIFLLEKFIEKIVTRKIRFMFICTVIPIIIFCIGMLTLNLNFFNIQKDVAGIDKSLLGDVDPLNAALLSVTSLLIALSFIYLIVFVMYVIIYNIIHKNENVKNKKESIK